MSVTRSKRYLSVKGEHAGRDTLPCRCLLITYPCNKAKKDYALHSNLPYIYNAKIIYPLLIDQ
jgi:hypothetical protein